ncbi:MAG: ChbG/HpnK family deacetylase [Pseudomonadota bacterium]
MERGPRAIKYIINGDDFGASPNVNKGFLEAADNGLLHSASVLATGAAFEQAMHAARERPSLQVRLHLNLVEGFALSERHAIPDLVDARGVFSCSFGKLLAISVGPSKLRDRYRAQIKTELSAQIERFWQALGEHGQTNGLMVDSHVHFHMIPVVFEALMEIHEHTPLAYVRNPYERLFLKEGKLSPRHHLGVNLIKNCLLRILAKRVKSELVARDIAFFDRIVGVLFTDAMNQAVVASAVAQLNNEDGTHSAEILMHPGRASEDEAELWPQKVFRDYYRSPQRDIERETLLNPQFKALFVD